jgi:hypothetical protein
MDTTYAKLLEILKQYQLHDFRNDIDRERVRIETLEYIIQTMLEKLRDADD